MIHVVFEQANVDALRKSFELDETMRGEIVEIKDDFAVGPLQNIFTEEGIENRLQWWREILKGGHYDGIADDGHVDDQKTVRELRQKLNENAEEKLWIWAAQNKHDVCSYYWLMSQLKDYQGRIFILYLNNLPFINEKGQIFYPTGLFQIQPREFVKAKKLARPITLSEFEIDPDEWLKLCEQNKGVRLLEGGKKLVQRDYDYYDDQLLKAMGKDWQRVNKFFQQFFNKAKDTTGDAFLIWRLRVLIEQGKVEMQGDTKNMKEYEIKLPGQAAEATVPAEAAEHA